MTHKRKYLYLAMLALGGFALVLDRALLPTSLSTPTTAAASLIAARGASQQSSVTQDNTSISIPEMPFPENLPPFDSRFTMRDIFAPPVVGSKTGLLQDNADNEGSDIAHHTNAVRSDIFKTQHRLDAILNGPRLKIAVMDGLWIHVGDILDGCKLQTIEGTSVVFSCRDGSAILNLTTTDISIPD